VLIEVLVAATVAAILIVQMIRLARDRSWGIAETAAANDALVVARSLIAEASRRDALVAGERTGELAGHRWRVVVTPTDCLSAPSADGRPAKPVAVEACGRDGWILARVRVEVAIAEGRTTGLETWRLGHVRR
jgi:hypothetical protein